MQSAAQAYGKVAKEISSPRELEASLLLKAAARLQAVRDAWDQRSGELAEALGEAALAACPEISQVDLAMPNKHYLLVDLTPFGLKNNNEVFTPTDAPHGQIEATVSRE